MQAQARICPTCKDDHSADVDCLQYAQRQNEMLSRRNAQLEAVAEAAEKVVRIEKDRMRCIREGTNRAPLVTATDLGRAIDELAESLAALKGGKDDGE